jgi:hypothetical protein
VYDALVWIGQVLIESYGPIAGLGLYLEWRQRQIIAVLMEVAEELEDVNAADVYDKISLRSDD